MGLPLPGPVQPARSILRLADRSTGGLPAGTPAVPAETARAGRRLRGTSPTASGETRPGSAFSRAGAARNPPRRVLVGSTPVAGAGFGSAANSRHTARQGAKVLFETPTLSQDKTNSAGEPRIARFQTLERGDGSNQGREIGAGAANHSVRRRQGGGHVRWFRRVPRRRWLPIKSLEPSASSSRTPRLPRALSTRSPSRPVRMPQPP